MNPRLDSKVVRRARRIARLVGAVLGLVGGIFYGLFVIVNSATPAITNRALGVVLLLAFGGIGMVCGILVGPALSVDPYLWVEDFLDSASADEILGAILGLVVALIISALLAVLLHDIPAGIGLILSLVISAVLINVGVRTGIRRRGDVMRATSASLPSSSVIPAPPLMSTVEGAQVVVDTSVLIDGRIVDVAHLGFLPVHLVIPSFVLEELQRVADSGDPIRRAKGHRGLDVVETLKAGDDIACEFPRVDSPKDTDVDVALVKLAKARGVSIMTNDYNLNRIARIEGIRVLNLNDLANALKPIVGAGESLDVMVVKEGKEPNQGVAYLADGTMVVVEGGRDYIDRAVTVTVTSVLQTAAGRMIFSMVPAAESVATAKKSTRAMRANSR